MAGVGGLFSIGSDYIGLLDNLLEWWLALGFDSLILRESTGVEAPLMIKYF